MVIIFVCKIAKEQLNDKKCLNKELIRETLSKLKTIIGPQMH